MIKKMNQDLLLELNNLYIMANLELFHFYKNISLIEREVYCSFCKEFLFKESPSRAENYEFNNNTQKIFWHAYTHYDRLKKLVVFK